MTVRQAIQQMMDSVIISDPRVEGRVIYPLLPALFSIIMAWCAGCNSATTAADFIRTEKDKLAKIIPDFGPCGNISHDTVLRLIKMVKFSELQQFLMDFTTRLVQSTDTSGPRVLALDGQTPRSIIYEPKAGQKSPQDRRTYDHQYYVTLYDSTSRMTLAQEDVYDKENENKACIRLCALFDLNGCVVTGDALNTTRAVAKAIIAQNGDYCLAVKDNKKKLANEMKACFADAELLDNRAVYSDSQVELGHGRVENRLVIALPASCIKSRILGEWAEDAGTIFFARTCTHDKKYGLDKEHIIRYYISSLDFDDPNIAEYGKQVIRSHWGCENSQHYVLDVTYGQDMLRAKNRNYVRNALLLNKIALNTTRVAQQEYRKTDSQITIRRLKLLMSRQPEMTARFLCQAILNPPSDAENA